MAGGILAGPAVAQGNLGNALFTRRDSARALVVWLGALAYISYQGVLFLFASPFNSLFLIYVAMMSLAFWSIAVIARTADLQAFREDLAIWLPLLVGGAWSLWNRRPLGELIVGAMLVTVVLKAIGVATDQWFGASADPGTPFASVAAIPMFLLLALVGAVPLFFYVKHLDSRVVEGVYS